MPLIEHASMTLAKLAGITVAETQVVPLVGEHALAVRRFDRNGILRIHCISAGTALRAETVAGQEPELGYPSFAQLLRRVGVTQDGLNLFDMQELFRRMVFNILIDNTDDHEKNHALRVVEPTRHGKYRLAPAYDVLTTNSGQGYQEFDLYDSKMQFCASSFCQIQFNVKELKNRSNSPGSEGVPPSRTEGKMPSLRGFFHHLGWLTMP